MEYKILEVFKERRLIRTLAEAVNFVLIRLMGVKISKQIGIEGYSIARRVFKNRHLKKSDQGYFYVDPMPSEEELTTYYSNTYWDSREGKNYGVSARDLVHYNLLKSQIPDFFKDTNKLVVNFGAGHGGISNLLWLSGFDIINVEPSGLPQFYSSRWTNFISTVDIEDNSVDLIYGSHSLEHVQNIDSFKEEMKRILKPDAYLFWEVPNAIHPLNGSMNNRIDIPHTYYFLKEFFDGWLGEVILNDAFDQSHVDGIIEKWVDYKNDTGVVIRVLGRL
jgi:SAM-dependent methyltransferase